jgi:rhodanese-related sulfurtransferase
VIPADRTSGSPEFADRGRQRVRSRLLIGLLAAIAAGVVAYFVLGMPGMDHSAMDESSMALSVTDFAAAMGEGEVFLVDLRSRAPKRIPGTDAAVPAALVARDLHLPQDRTTQYLLYDATGSIAPRAATALMDAGFMDVSYLDGGVDAWLRAGRPLTRAAG